MSTTANSSSLFNSFKQRLGAAKVGYSSSGGYMSGFNGRDPVNPGSFSISYVNERAPILKELTTELAKKDVDLNAAKNNIDRNRAASNARSAFAAGAASRTKKLFKPRAGGNYGAIGRTDAATSKAIADREKEIIDLRSLDPSLDVSTGKRRASRGPSISVGAPIRIW